MVARTLRPMTDAELNAYHGLGQLCSMSRICTEAAAFHGDVRTSPCRGGPAHRQKHAGVCQTCTPIPEKTSTRGEKDRMTEPGWGRLFRLSGVLADLPSGTVLHGMRQPDGAALVYMPDREHWLAADSVDELMVVVAGTVVEWADDAKPAKPAEGGSQESYCGRCGGPNTPWSAPSPLWNQVMRGGDINGDEPYDGIICPTCFAILAEEAGIADRWQLDARRVHVALQTVTPSGRIWDPASSMWVEPDTKMIRYRTGGRVRKNLYDTFRQASDGGDLDIGRMDTPELGQLVADALNAGEQLRDQISVEFHQRLEASRTEFDRQLRLMADVVRRDERERISKQLDELAAVAAGVKADAYRHAAAIALRRAPASEPSTPSVLDPRGEEPATGQPFHEKTCQCSHLMLRHDVEEYPGDGTEMCCVDGCTQQGCPGKKTSAPTTDPTPEGGP